MEIDTKVNDGNPTTGNGREQVTTLHFRQRERPGAVLRRTITITREPLAR